MDYLQKHGKISFGADSVENDIKKKTIKLVIVSEDSSNRTKDKFKKIAEQHQKPVIVAGTIEELSKAIGKNNKAILGILDENLSNEIQKINNGGEVIG